MDKKCPVCCGTWGFITLITKPLYIEPAESISHPQITPYSRSSLLFVGLLSHPRHSSDLQHKILKEFLNNIPSRSVTLISVPRTSCEFKLLRSPLHNFLELPDNFSRLKCKHYPQHSAALGKTFAATWWRTRRYFWPTVRSQHTPFIDCLFHDDFNSSEYTLSNDTIIGQEETGNNVERRGRSSTGGRIQEFPAKTWGNNEMSQARQPVSGPRFKPGTSRILCNNATHFTAKFSHSRRHSWVLATQLVSNST